MKRRIFTILFGMAIALSPILADDKHGGGNSGPGSSSSGSNDDGKGRQEDRQQDRREDRQQNRLEDRQEDRQQDRREDHDAPGDNAAGEARIKSSLAATSAGQSVNAKAVVDIRVRGDRQRFKVELEARVNDGATFLVVANGQAAGTLVMSLGEGELEVSNEDGRTLPAAVSPVNAVRQVMILDARGVVIAEGNL